MTLFPSQKTEKGKAGWSGRARSLILKLPGDLEPRHVGETRWARLERSPLEWQSSFQNDRNLPRPSCFSGLLQWAAPAVAHQPCHSPWPPFSFCPLAVSSVGRGFLTSRVVISTAICSRLQEPSCSSRTHNRKVRTRRHGRGQ